MVIQNINPTIKYALIIIIILIGAYFAFEIIRTAFLIKKGVNLAEESIPFERKNPSADIKILFLGDSTAVGTGAKDNRLSTAGRFGTDFPNAQIINLGENGKKVKTLLEEFDPEKHQGFDLVMIQVGGNDILKFSKLSELEKDLPLLLQKAKKSGEKVVLLTSGNIGLAPFFHWPFNKFYEIRTKKAVNYIDKITKEEGVTYVNLYTDKANDPLLKDINRYYAEDLLHLTGEGYGIWYAKIRDAMKRDNIILQEKRI